MRLLSGLLLLPLLGGCAGYAADYVRPRTALIQTEQMSRYGLSATQAQCVSERLQGSLSVWQLRQLADTAAAARRSDGAALSPRDFIAVASNVTDPAVPRAVAEAGNACALGASAAAVAEAAPGLEPGPAPAAADGPAVTAPSAEAAAAPPAASTAWVNLGAAATGQAIAVQAASVQQQGLIRTAWFRLTNPGQSAASAVSYLLRIDCTARTINPMAFRQYGPDGTVAAERDHGPTGEGALPVESGTVMEIAFLALCT